MPTGDPPKGSGSINWPMYPKEYETHNSLRTPARVAEVKAAGYKVPSRAPEGLGQNNDRMQVGRRLALLSLGPRPVLMQALALDTCQDDLIGHRALSAARALTVCRRTRTGAVSPVRSTRRRYKCTVPKRTWSQDTTTHLLSSTRAQTRLTPSKPRQRTIGPTSMRLRTTTLNSRSDTRRGVVSTESGRSLVQRALAHMRMGMARAPVSLSCNLSRRLATDARGRRVSNSSNSSIWNRLAGYTYSTPPMTDRVLRLVPQIGERAIDRRTKSVAKRSALSCKRTRTLGHYHTEPY